jgi:hypothetical protein
VFSSQKPLQLTAAGIETVACLWDEPGEASAIVYLLVCVVYNTCKPCTSIDVTSQMHIIAMLILHIVSLCGQCDIVMEGGMCCASTCWAFMSSTV